jgi:general nucleoside transport system ATP-binding protein
MSRSSRASQSLPSEAATGLATSDGVVPLLELRNISKHFGSLVANDNISLTLRRGEIVALLGENGAGKSTLVNILFGHYVADSGEVLVDGLRLPAGNPRAALAAGIGMVSQHFNLAENLTVLDNVILGTEHLWSGFSRRRAAIARLEETAKRLNFKIEPNTLISDLSVGECQRVEIAKALYRGARILILDEPTSVLTPTEAADLFVLLRSLASSGVGIIFISHKLDEVLAISNRVVVLRGGRLAATREIENVTVNELAELVIGDRAPPPLERSQNSNVAPAPKLAVTRLASGKLREATFEVRAGEIFGIAGIAGNGQADLCNVLFGLASPANGKIEFDGKVIPYDPGARVQYGVARIPQDRAALGIVGELSAWENAVSERRHSPDFQGFGFVRRKQAQRFTRDIILNFDIRCRDIRLPARQMSGGNIQKLILGRALHGNPGIIIAVQPTWGLDIGAVAYVHRQLLAARERGAAILLVSEDLDELFAIADRIAVMAGGHLSAPSRTWSATEIGLAMTASAG